MGAPLGQSCVLLFIPMSSGPNALLGRAEAPHVIHASGRARGSVLRRNVPLTRRSLLMWGSKGNGPDGAHAFSSRRHVFPDGLILYLWWPKCEVLLCFPILVSCLRIRVFPAEGRVRGIRLNSVFRNGSLSVFFFLSSFSCPEWVQRLEWIMFLYPWHIIIMGLLRFLCFIYTSITFSHSLWPTKVPIDNR